jgi:signal transduction histidine kinase
VSSHVTPDRERLAGLAGEQTALRHIATLVARGVPAAQIFDAVAEEVGVLLGVEAAGVQRFEPDEEGTVVGRWGQLAGDAFPVGRRFKLDGNSATAVVYRTQRSARIDSFQPALGPTAEELRELGVRSAVASPIIVNGHLWGALVAASSRPEPLPADAESRIAEFTELVATAISNVQVRAEAERLAEEQAALRRVATMVAQGAPPDEVFAQVAEEAGLRLGVEIVAIHRFEPDGEGCVVGSWGRLGDRVPVGHRLKLDGDSTPALVYRTGRPARVEHYATASGSIAADARRLGLGSAVASPIVVNGRLWGAMAAGTSRAKRLPTDAEERVEKFTELVGTAIANAQSRAELAASEARAHRLAREQAGLRRIATLIAEAAQPDDVFSAVAREVASVFGVELVTVCRYDADDIVVLSSVGIPALPAGSRWSLEVPSLPGSISATGGPVRIDDFTDAAGLDALARDAGVKAAVGVPILVEGTVWGSINTAAAEDEPLPADAEERLARFTELVATSVSNATMRAELAASRARIVAAADQERRRVVRDLHDGAQQRLVHTIITLKLAQGERDHEEARALVGDARQHAEQANAELRDLAHGILPSVLTHGGLRAAAAALAARVAIPVQADISVDRLPQAVEATAYFIVAEALTNIDKHSHAQRAEVTARMRNGTVEIRIRDDGIGGARPDGSGLVGLRDRVEALGGTMTIDSPDRRGTTLVAKLPLNDSVAA